MSDTKPQRKTKGVDLKVPVQAIVTLVTAALAYYGIDLDTPTSLALAVVIGTIVGALAPAPETYVSRAGRARGNSGQVNVIAVAAITALAVVLLVILLLR